MIRIDPTDPWEIRYRKQPSRDQCPTHDPVKQSMRGEWFHEEKAETKRKKKCDGPPYQFIATVTLCRRWHTVALRDGPERGIKKIFRGNLCRNGEARYDSGPDHGEWL